MGNPKLSLVIPYENRLDNLKLALRALLDQTMDPAEFEVVVGTTKYDPRYLAVADQAARRINLVTVMAHEDFEIPRTRNMAIRQATGTVIVNIDADTFLPPDALANLYQRYYAFGQNACIVGQVLGYGNNYDGDVSYVEPEPYEIWRERLDEVRTTVDQPRDPRFQVEHVIPWSFAWTGLIALPACLLHEHNLYFDESLRGWGIDDIEWGYRIAATGTPIVLRRDLYALHLPHTRDSAANFITETLTYRQFLRKWPGPDVELAAAFNDVDANTHYLGYLAELRAATPSGATTLGMVRASTGDGIDLYLGVALDGQRIVDADVWRAVAAADSVEVAPLLGMALPDPDASAASCRIRPTVERFSRPYRDRVHATAARVARSVVVDPA